MTARQTATASTTTRARHANRINTIPEVAAPMPAASIRIGKHGRPSTVTGPSARVTPQRRKPTAPTSRATSKACSAAIRGEHLLMPKSGLVHV